MEDIDRKIVSLLCLDGRISFTELSRQTGLSVSATHQRVRRLERRGVIKGYAAMVDPAGAGLPLTAFISIKPFDPAAPDDAPERLAHLPAIEACHSVAGDENYILKVRVASPTALEDLLQQIRACAGVSTRTTIVLSTPYENRPPDLEHSGEGSSGADAGDPERPEADGSHPGRAHPDGSHPDGHHAGNTHHGTPRGTTGAGTTPPGTTPPGTTPPGTTPPGTTPPGTTPPGTTGAG